MAHDGKNIQQLTNEDFNETTPTFSPDGKTILSGSNDKTLRLWNKDNEKELQILKGHKHAVNSVVFSPDGTLAAAGVRDRTIRIWNVTACCSAQSCSSCRKGTEPY